MTLDGPAMKELRDALLDAFPTRDALAQMVRFGLGENLENITGNGPLSAAVFELIKWAEAHGRTDELVRAALAANPGNPALLAVAGRHGMTPTAASPQAAVATPSAAAPTTYELHAAAVSAGLTAQRPALLAHLPSTFVASLALSSSPGAQLLMDLNALDVTLDDGTRPLTVWLRNAYHLSAGRGEARVFRRALEARGASLPAADAVPQGGPAPGPAATPAPLTRRAVRNLVNEMLRSDSDLNAFCLDFFDDVHARFTNGMDRIAKVDLLLVHAPLERIVSALRESDPNAFAKHAAHLHGA
jgi:hypothetical protein